VDNRGGAKNEKVLSHRFSDAEIQEETVNDPRAFSVSPCAAFRKNDRLALPCQSCMFGAPMRTFTSANLASRSFGDVAGIFFKAVSSLDRLLSIGEESLPLPTPLTPLASPFIMSSSSAALSRVGRPGPVGPAPLYGPAVRLLRVGILMPPGKSVFSVPQMEGSQGYALRTWRS
jgi:hypothetical protein